MLYTENETKLKNSTTVFNGNESKIDSEKYAKTKRSYSFPVFSREKKESGKSELKFYGYGVPK